MIVEITETKYEWKIGEYFVRTWCGEYGTHTEWFKNDTFIDSEDVPEIVREAHEQFCEEEGL